MIKKIRFFIQLSFFICSTILLLSFDQGNQAHDFFRSLHFFPTFSYLAKFIFPTFLYITLFMLIIPLLIGRIYCSYLCPVGFIQDIVFKIIKKTKVPQKFFPILSFISNLILILSLLLIFTASNYQGLFDHFSHFIRLFSLTHSVGYVSFIFILLFLFSILVIPIIAPRFFCQGLCPSGAIYKILNLNALFNINASKACNHCGVCETKCPTLCIRDGAIIKEACITCFECLESCPQKAFEITFKFPWRKRKDFLNQNKKRRETFKTLLLIGSGLLAFFAIKKTGSANLMGTHLVIPPGAKSLRHFYSSCTGCNLCLTVCPTKVLKSGSTLNGYDGTNKPYLDFDEAYCSFECNACLSVCPTGALAYDGLAQKQLIKIGESKIDETSCIPYVHKRICGSCAEHCPTGAIQMVLIDNVLAPKVDRNFCIGCGICQKVCPTSPKSIKIAPLTIHTYAYSPKKNNIPKKPSISNEDFPF
ncbi:MAG: hypothetical protein A2381_14560 [Bdellovibrionales bacterium RIFOXYB1_FULL_37_110]|nr:MAG: hypothetical protein A2417_03220 [Bdellovibrionales bacterium RIFOXYC1_FULL_37_79]OFZ58361.1 MAG: hypothetical protein A2381_14560 [Bdellovibrionales bacterium RIFOXYB1_FULL_37_110]OFZ62699.1 MAG: hypothetical protein A2577_02270 [Bdellovibrionales bacterium RIFOXYD1_FULL_36_51]